MWYPDRLRWLLPFLAVALLAVASVEPDGTVVLLPLIVMALVVAGGLAFDAWCERHPRS
jgi:phenolic acid decarboxylase